MLVSRDSSLLGLESTSIMLKLYDFMCGHTWQWSRKGPRRLGKLGPPSWSPGSVARSLPRGSALRLKASCSFMIYTRTLPVLESLSCSRLLKFWRFPLLSCYSPLYPLGFCSLHSGPFSSTIPYHQHHPDDEAALLLSGRLTHLPSLVYLDPRSPCLPSLVGKWLCLNGVLCALCSPASQYSSPHTCLFELGGLLIHTTAYIEATT